MIADCDIDLAFLLDGSGSIRDNDEPGGNNWLLIVNFVKSIINAFTDGQKITRFACAYFGKFACNGATTFLKLEITIKLQRLKYLIIIIIIIIIRRIYTRRLKAEVTRRHSLNQSNKCVFSCALNCS